MKTPKPPLPWTVPGTIWIRISLFLLGLWGSGVVYGQFSPRLRLEGQVGYGQLSHEKLAVPDFPFYQEVQSGHGFGWSLTLNWRMKNRDRLFLTGEIGQHFWPDWRASGNLTPERKPRTEPYLTDLLARSAQAFHFGAGVNLTLRPWGRFEPSLTGGLRYQFFQIDQDPRYFRIEGQQTRYVWQEAGYKLQAGSLGLRLGAGFNYHFSPLFYASLRAHAQGNWQGQTELLPATFGQFDATLGLGFRLFPSPSRFR